MNPVQLITSLACLVLAIAPVLIGAIVVAYAAGIIKDPPVRKPLQMSRADIERTYAMESVRRQVGPFWHKDVA